MHRHTLVGVLLGAAAALAVPAQASKDVLDRSADPNQWVIQTGDYANQRYSKLDQINRDNVKNLKVAWTFSTGVLRGHEGSPLVVGDVMYVHTPFPNIVYALDLKNEGKIIWKYEPKQDPSVIPVMCCDTVYRGVAYADGTIFLYQADTTLVALDAKHRQGELEGRQRRSQEGRNQHSDRAAGEGQGHRRHLRRRVRRAGHVTAYDARRQALWRAYTLGPDSKTLFDPEKTTSLGKPVGKDSSLKTWNGEQWKIGGGSAWGWYSYDPETNLFFYGTANPSTWNPVQRAGPDGKPIDQKWTMSIIARDADTGTARWAYQMTPFDEWDYDGINELILADIDVKGQKRKALVHFDRNGLGYTLDRVDGRAARGRKVRPCGQLDQRRRDGQEQSAVWPSPGRQAVLDLPDRPGQEHQGVCPAALGTKDQQPAAFSPRTNLFYVPTNHVCMDYEPFRVSYTAGQPYVGATLSMFPAPGSHGGMGNFVAWDAGQGKIAWSKPEQFSVWSGALATAGGVVFYGTLEGYLKAVDEKDGKELYKFKTPSGIIGNVMTYSHGGKQYVAVLSGVGGWAGIGLAAGLTNPTDGLGAVGGYAGLRDYTALGGTLTVFTLP